MKKILNGKKIFLKILPKILGYLFQYLNYIAKGGKTILATCS
jgi:hypothetical protein